MKGTEIEKLILIREQNESGVVPDMGKMIPHFQRCGFPLQRPAADYLKHQRQLCCNNFSGPKMLG